MNDPATTPVPSAQWVAKEAIKNDRAIAIHGTAGVPRRTRFEFPYRSVRRIVAPVGPSYDSTPPSPSPSTRGAPPVTAASTSITLSRPFVP